MNTQVAITLVDTPVGQLAITADNFAVQRIHFQHLNVVPDRRDTKVTHLHQPATQNAKLAMADIIERIVAYFSLAHNDWPLASIADNASQFQRKVWHYLPTIPLGETRTYSDIANALATHQRPIAGACKANPFIIMLPCHRVVSTTGIGGYAGRVDDDAIAVKKWLLDHERH